jgi:hypothetical protein
MRPLVLIFAMLLCVAPAAATEGSPSVEVWKSANCGCCIDWVEHLQDNGFAVKTNDTDQTTLDQIKRMAGITDKLSSCHTGKVEGYVLEGHVPASDVKRLLAERPDAKGLTVPGMPIGSPGMEVDGEPAEPFEVLLVKKDGTTEVFAKH